MLGWIEMDEFLVLFPPTHGSSLTSLSFVNMYSSLPVLHIHYFSSYILPPYYTFLHYDTIESHFEGSALAPQILSESANPAILTHYSFPNDRRARNHGVTYL
jgi:hypothetical protein